MKSGGMVGGAHGGISIRESRLKNEQPMIQIDEKLEASDSDARTTLIARPSEEGSEEEDEEEEDELGRSEENIDLQEIEIIKSNTN